MTPPVITFTDVWKSYPSYNRITGGIKSFLFHLPQALRELGQRRTALEGVNFEIRKGESFGFIGRNGAGKSTLLGLIAGVLAPERGTVAVNGRVSPLLELGAGFHPELTGRENILLNGVLLGLTRAEVDAHTEEIIAFSELGEFIDQPVRTYSSGMYAKLGFAVVSTLNPEILLVDEILSVGDLAFSHKCEKKFEDFRTHQDVTIVLVSHSLGSVAALCDRAAWVENKTIRMIGPAGEVIKEYEAANAPTVAVEETIAPLPPHVRTGLTVVDCSTEPARLDLYASWSEPEIPVRVTLLHGDGVRVVRRWLISPQPVVIAHTAEKGWTLSQIEPAPAVLPPEASAAITDASSAEPLLLRIQGEQAGQPYGPPAWSVVLADKEARLRYEETEKNRILSAAGNGFPPHVWPGGKTVRVVARNIVNNDAVGNFAVGMAATLSRYGIPARLYAYVSCAELAGVVSSVGDLERETDPDDIIFYHYSTEDEFLPLIAGLVCRRKILYYHNVTPGHWFRECCPALADALERARRQYPLFASFDAVAANSSFSLADVLPYLSEGVPTTVFPPSMSPDKLASLRPEPVSVPEAAHILLWVGRAVPHKRPDAALRLFENLSRLRDDTALVMVAGGKRDFPQMIRVLEERLAALPEEVRKRACLVEGLNDAQLAWLYRRASLFLCTSGHEGYCLPIREAMSFGLPVAAFPQPAVEETLAGQGTILPEDMEAAARRLHDLLRTATSANAAENEFTAIAPGCLPRPDGLRKAVPDPKENHSQQECGGNIRP